jgi:hypothetical protein
MIPHRTGKAGRMKAAIAALLLLSLLGACNVLRADLLPNLVVPLPYLERQVLPLALLALAQAVIAIARGAKWPRGFRIRASLLIGLGLFAAPACLLYL